MNIGKRFKNLQEVREILMNHSFMPLVEMGWMEFFINNGHYIVLSCDPNGPPYNKLNVDTAPPCTINYAYFNKNNELVLDS